MRKLFGPTLSLIAAFAAIASASASAAPGSAALHRSAAAGMLKKVSRTASSITGAGAASPIRGARQIPRSGSVFSSAAPALRGAPTGVQAAAAPLLANFNGVSSLGSAVTNFNLEFEPPDQGLCAGNGFVVEMVNSAYRVYRPNGSVIQGPFNVNDPFDEGAKEFTSDPRCHYDASTGKWFATILFINSTFTVSRIDLAVSQTNDPTGLWNKYQIDTTDIGHTTGPKHRGCPCLGDQPTLGIDATNVYVTTNEFSLVGPQFNGAQIYAIAKHDLVKGLPSAHFVHFENLTIGGAIAASVQPALTSGSPEGEFFMNSLDPTGSGDHRVGVWAMTKESQVEKGGVPTLSSIVIGSEAYAIPPGAEQRGSSSTLDAGDDRMQQTQFIDGHLWGELDTALTIPGDSQPRAAAAWFDTTPTIADGVIDSANMKHQGYVAVKGNYVLYPALQVAPNGTAAMVATLSGASRFPSAAYTTIAPGGMSFGPLTVAAAGTTHYDPAATRWGDYSWAVLDPSGTSVWLATEYVPPLSSQTPDRLRNWGTRVMDVSTGP